MLKDLGTPFQARGIPIKWEATSSLPDSVAVFKVAPTRFTYGFVSNFVAVTGFADPSKALSKLIPALEGRESSYSETEKAEFVGLSPSRGRAYYRNERAIRLPGQPIATVPDYPQIIQTALRILTHLSIDPSELATRPGTKELVIVRSSREQTRFDKVAGKSVKSTIARGISLFRATNGITFTGRGMCDGVYLSVGGGQEIAELELVWRNLRPDRSVPVADTREILERIRTGKAVIQLEDQIDQIKRLTVRDAVLYYFGRDGLEIQTMVYPFIALNALAQIGDTNVEVVIDCPILR